MGPSGARQPGATQALLDAVFELGPEVRWYGPFFQVVMPRAGGHVSVALEPTADPVAFAGRLRERLDEGDR